MVNNKIILNNEYAEGLDNLLNPEFHIERTDLYDAFISSLGLFYINNPEYNFLDTNIESLNPGDEVMYINTGVVCEVLFVSEYVLIKYNENIKCLVDKSSLIIDNSNKLKYDQIRFIYESVRLTILELNPINKSILPYFSIFVDHFMLDPKIVYNSLSPTNQTLLAEELEDITKIFSDRYKVF